jgi:predicted transcriptional regulator YdeE
MEPTAVATGGFLVVGLRTRTTNRIEAVPEMAKIAPLWRRFCDDKVSDRVPQRLPGSSEVIAVYFDFKSGYQDQYSLIVGHKVSSLDNLPPEMGGVLVRPGRYLRFPVEARTVPALLDAWHAIWQFFELSHEYDRTYGTDYELYRGDEVEIYVGVQQSAGEQPSEFSGG